MIRTITLENFRSFGASQTVALGKLTVLVGPNNSGKSAFMSVGQLFSDIRYSTYGGRLVADESMVHRPLGSPSSTSIGTRGDGGSYTTRFHLTNGTFVSESETALLENGKSIWELRPSVNGSSAAIDFPLLNLSAGLLPGRIFGGLETLKGLQDRAPNLWGPIAPLTESRLIRLSLDRLRDDAQPTRAPKLESSGAGMAQVVAHWRESFPEKSAELDAFVSSCVSEVRHVLTTPSPEKDAEGRELPAGTKRLLIQQTDGQRFDAQRISDGLLCFIALAMNAIDAGPGSILFVEEPETSIHPTRIHQIVELLRTTAEKRGCQIVIATHSPLVVNEFRDEPESILLFRRSPTGTQVRALADLPEVEKQLHRLSPAELFQSGIFDKSFEQLATQESAAGASK